MNFLIVGISSVASIIIARTLGPEGRGEYAAIIAWFTIAEVVSEFGQSGAVTYWVAHNPSGAPGYVATSRLFMTVLGAIVALIGVAFSPLLSGGDSQLTISYQVAFLCCIANGISAAQMYALQSVSLRRWNIVRIAQPGGYIVIIALLLFSGSLTVFSVTLALLGSIVAQFILAYWHASREGLSGGRTAREAMRPLSRYGYLYAAAAVPNSIAGQYDRLALSQTLSSAALGSYAVASTVAGLVAPFSTAVSSVMFPATSRASLGSPRRRIVERNSLIATGAASAIICGVLAVAAFLIPVIFGTGFEDAIALVWIVSPAMVFRSLSSVLGALLGGRKRPGLATYSQLVVLGVGASVIFPMISLFGVVGAALSIDLGELAGLVTGIVLLMREQRRDRMSGVGEVSA